MSRASSAPTLASRPNCRGSAFRIWADGPAPNLVATVPWSPIAIGYLSLSRCRGLRLATALRGSICKNRDCNETCSSVCRRLQLWPSPHSRCMTKRPGLFFKTLATVAKVWTGHGLCHFRPYIRLQQTIAGRPRNGKVDVYSAIAYGPIVLQTLGNCCQEWPSKR